MSRWFRMYDELLDDPKVQRLPGEDFKAWVNILCLASRHDGALPALADIAFALRVDEKKATATLGRLVSAGLLDREDDRFSPHGWNARQYKSDVSTERVKRFRKRSNAVSETSHETPPETETETEIPLAKANAPIDAEKVMFDSGIALLKASGKTDGQARSLLGKWKRDHGSGDVIEALGAAQRQGAIDPVSWIEGRWRTVAKNGEWVSPC